jgi:drug/metabolite transporter (DMT)-like permease
MSPSWFGFALPSWYGWLALALVSWGLWAVFAKLVGSRLSAVQSQALSTIGIAPIVVYFSFAEDSNPQLNWRLGVFLSLAAGAASCLANLPYYGVLSRGAKAATVAPLTSLYPIVTILLAVPLLGESMTLLQMLGVATSLVAIYLFNVPAEGEFWSPWLAPVLLAILLWGIAGFLQKLSTNHVSGEQSSLWFHVAFLVIGLAMFVVVPWPRVPTATTWLLAGGLGLSMALGNAAILLAYADGGKASVVTPMAGLYPLVSLPISLLVLGERIGRREACGIGFALAAVYMLA